MENASKALIIAGAILLSILIIGIGVYIYNGAAGTIKKANLNSQEIQQYNAEFLAYEGEHISGSQAMALCDIVKQHDLANLKDPSKQIQVVDTTANEIVNASTFSDSQAATATNVKKKLRSGYTYTITFGYDSETGYVTQVGIVQN